MGKQDVIDMMICAVIFGAVFLVMMIALSIVGYASDIHGKEYVTYHEAGYNMTTYALMNAEQHLITYEKEERRRKRIEKEKRAKELEEEKEAQEARKALEETYKRLFGYVPSESEIRLLKGITQAESGNTEPLLGIERVIEVIANRCRSSRFPNTIYGVVTQRNQFETYSNGTYQRGVNSRVETAWQNVLSRGECVDKSVLFFTAGRYNPYCVPGYIIGHHYFGY